MTDFAFAAACEEMIEQIISTALESAATTDRPTLAPNVMDAMRAVPRHRFVDEASQNAAYENRPLPIGHGQTISQPFIVAIMTDLLDLRDYDRVLEVGTGSGYQAAVLAKLVADVWTIERNRQIAERTQGLFADLELSNIHTRVADGAAGWRDEAPFDAIIVTAAASHIPTPLVDQLAPGGRLVIPVGPHGETQTLFRCEKRSDGTLHEAVKLSVAFVPLITDV
jgi:protein-L-isoaspartate(D-aspartate) O-methyltransferase